MTTPVPFQHHFKQLGTVSAQVEAMNQPVEDAGGSNFYLCIVLVTPEVDGCRMQVGMNWHFNLELSHSINNFYYLGKHNHIEFLVPDTAL
jgi:hypothetical protein